MGLDPTIFARPAPPRFSVALGISLAMAFLAGSVVGSLSAAAAAALGGLLTWRFGPLIGGVVVGALSAVVVMADPLLVHPMPFKLLVWVVALMVLAMATGMVARRDSARAEESAHTPPERPIPARARETPIRSARVTGEHPRLRSNPEMPKLVLPVELPRDQPAPQTPISTEGTTSELLAQELERGVVQRFLRDVRDVLGADEVALWQYFEDNDEVRTYAAAVQSPEELVIETKPPVDSLVHAASVGGIGTNYDNELNYFYAVPAGAEGRFHGALGVYAEDRQNFNRDRAKQQMRGFTDRLAELLHLLYDGREARRLRGKVEQVADAVETVQKQPDMASLHEEVCRAALRVTGGSRAAFVTWDGETKTGTVERMEPPGPSAPVVAPASLAGMAATTTKFASFRENFPRAGIPLFAASESFPKPGSAIAAGLHGDGHVAGVIVVMGDQSGQVSAVELNLLRRLAQTAYAAWVRVNELEQAKGQAVRDGLTGLHNRRAFDERMTSFMAASDRFGHKTSLILVDVDKFKNINDTFGHAAGDEVLKALARTLSAMVRDADFLARYGGEELAVVMPQTDGKTAQHVAERLRTAVERMKVVVNDKPIPVTASFGVACHPESVFGQENLFKAADEALYEAKHNGRNCVKFAAPKTGKT